MTEFEAELKRGDWVARVRGTLADVTDGGHALMGILDELSGKINPEQRVIVQRSDNMALIAQGISTVALSEAVLLSFIAYDDKPMTKEDLAGRLRQLGKTFSASTLEYKLVPSMCHDGLLNFIEIKNEGARGQSRRAYFLSERGKIEAERVKDGLARGIK